MIRYWLMATVARGVFPIMPKELEWWTRAYCRAVLDKMTEVRP